MTQHEINHAVVIWGCKPLILLVRTEGLEPSREISQGILSPSNSLVLSSPITSPQALSAH
jgi:hypothetical protein